MDDDKLAMLIVLPIAGLIFLALAVGGILVARDTIRRKGRWGINTEQVYCPGCGEAAPSIRFPRSLSQALWGGCTCEECGIDYDKWGRRVKSRKS